MILKNWLNLVGLAVANMDNVDIIDIFNIANMVSTLSNMGLRDASASKNVPIFFFLFHGNMIENVHFTHPENICVGFGLVIFGLEMLRKFISLTLFDWEGADLSPPSRICMLVLKRVPHF